MRGKHAPARLRWKVARLVALASLAIGGLSIWLATIEPGVRGKGAFGFIAIWFVLLGMVLWGGD